MPPTGKDHFRIDSIKIVVKKWQKKFAKLLQIFSIRKIASNVAKSANLWRNIKKSKFAKFANFWNFQNSLKRCQINVPIRGELMAHGKMAYGEMSRTEKHPKLVIEFSAQIIAWKILKIYINFPNTFLTVTIWGTLQLKFRFLSWTQSKIKLNKFINNTFHITNKQFILSNNPHLL